MYGLTSQILRASSSFPSNIAEGCGRRGDREMTRFLQIAAGSNSELEYQLLLSKDLGYLDEEEYNELNTQTIEVKRMLDSLLNKTRASANGQSIESK